MERLYVLGHPVAHSKSPAMHNAAYKALGLDWHYDFADYELKSEATGFLEAREWRALNVTMPWKPLAFEFATDCSSAAVLAQGANVLVNEGRRVFADNTDGKGCVSYLQRCGVTFEGAKVAVCGTGPTSLAIMHASAEAGAENVALLGRDSDKVQRALEAYCARLTHAASQTVFHAGSYGKSAEVLANASVIVDATPLGMHPGDPAPFDTNLLSAGQTVFDVVYGHGETALVRAAREMGCAAYDGAGMLVAQAVETVRDIASITKAFEIPSDLDLFAIMAEAAGFQC